MMEEDTKLLEIELCSRLPYHPKVEYKGKLHWVVGYVHGKVVITEPFMSQAFGVSIESVKLCLRLITEEDHNILCDLNAYIVGAWTEDALEWLYENHIDFRGLIPKGLAVETSKDKLL